MKHIRLAARSVVCGLLLWTCSALPVQGAAADDAFFQQRVAPVFEQHCVSCHSGAKPKGGFSLTTAKAALAGGESGAAIVPDKPDESQLLDFVSGDKPAMPKSGPRLKAEQVAAIREWIAAGARWPAGMTLVDKKPLDLDWWSLKPLLKSSVPVSKSPWIRTPIDQFILAKLEKNKLAPAPEADRRTLIRRLTYDLHGLPPTPEEIAAFEADRAPDAYEKLVDRLLASPRYGERWGRHWLDIVHFGETHGYDKDKVRPNAWPYRDYVIGAFNSDKPYSRFVAEQLAGDVIAPEDPQATVATGFIAAGPWDFVGHAELREGTVDKKIAESLDRDDMVMTTMSTFLSLTAHCARCHNHKFDPILQADYYRLQAVFAGIDRADRPYDADPNVAKKRFVLTAHRNDLLAEQQRFEAKVAGLKSPAIAAIDAQAKQLAAELAALPVDAKAASSTLGYHSQISAVQNVTKWVQVDLGQSRAIDELILVPSHVAYGGHPGPGFGFPPRFRVEISDARDFKTSRVVVDHTETDFPNPGDAWVRIPAGGKSARYVRITATKLWERTHDWIFAVAELAVMSGGRDVARTATVTSLDSIEAHPSWGMKNLVDGYSSLERLEFEPAGEPSGRARLIRQAAELQQHRAELVASLTDPQTQRRILDVTNQLNETNRQIAALPPQQMVYAAAHEFSPIGSCVPLAKPRPIYLLARGSVTSPKELMSPGALSCIRGLDPVFKLKNPDNEGERRAALAQWLTDPRNVLLRRSIVNRVWQYHFGQGIVDSPNDFGHMGSLPSHPELLDWLAGWFMEHGESIKALHRLIVTSAVYRQSSQDNAEFAKIDADNRLLWHMNRRRLDAESVHDAMLAADGKLDLKMGGPSVQQFFFKDDHSPVYDYERFNVDDPREFRRSVYRFIVRSVPDPFMDSLDCADPSILTPKRNTTLTAIQALAMFNDRFALRQAQHLAERVGAMRPDVASQIEEAYLLTLGRKPTANESKLLVDYAIRFGLNNACRVIFNSNEFLFVD
jgi:mono/diheme cytochrome c family protein